MTDLDRVKGQPAFPLETVDSVIAADADPMQQIQHLTRGHTVQSNLAEHIGESIPLLTRGAGLFCQDLRQPFGKLPRLDQGRIGIINEVPLCMRSHDGEDWIDLFEMPEILTAVV